MAEPRKFTRAEVARRNTLLDAAIIIDNVVYGVAEFVNDHPGGVDVLLDNAGKDASQCFRDVGHSDVALEWRKDFALGEIVDEERWEVAQALAVQEQPPEPLTFRTVLSVWGPPLVMASLAAIFYMYVFP